MLVDILDFLVRFTLPRTLYRPGQETLYLERTFYPVSVTKDMLEVTMRLLRINYISESPPEIALFKIIILIG